MSVEVTDAHARQYASNLALLSQQMVSKFSMAAMPGSYTGDAGQPVQHLGDVEMQEKGERHADLSPNEIPHEVPWIFPTEYYGLDYIDRADKLKSLVQLEGGYAQVFLAANNRKKDAVFVTALNADVKKGRNQGTTTTFPSANVIAHGSTGLNVDKTVQAQELMLNGDVDLEAEELHYAIGPRQWREYIQAADVKGIDTNAVKPLVEAGKRTIQFLGATFHIYTKLPLSGSTRSCFAWCKSGMHFGQWGSMENRVERNPTKSNTQVVLEDMYGAVRVDDAKVIEIQCTES